MRLAIPFTVAVLIIITLIVFQVYDQKTMVGKSKPLSHFTDNGDGTILDNGSKLIWLKNIDCIGDKTWAEALSICHSLADGICELTDGSSSGSWRVPNKKELQTLLYPENFSPALPQKHPFFGIKDGCFWVTATSPDGFCNVNYMYIGDGGAGLGGIFVCSNRYNRLHTSKFYLLPVRFDNNVQMD